MFGVVREEACTASTFCAILIILWPKVTDFYVNVKDHKLRQSFRSESIAQLARVQREREGRGRQRDQDEPRHEEKRQGNVEL